MGALSVTRLQAVLDFLEKAEALKDTLRSGFTGQGRQESTAEHSWRLCLLVMLFEKDMPGIDLLKLIKMCLVHDLGEALSGDVPAPAQGPRDGRAERERADLEALCQPLPDDLRQEILDLCSEYGAGESGEAILAKGFDKLETMLQHVKGLNPADFDYRFNLTYGSDQTAKHPLLQAVRALVDAQTLACAGRAEQSGSGR